MHFKPAVLLFSLLLPTAVLSAPVDLPYSGLSKRTLVVTVVPGGQFSRLVNQRPASPGAAPKGKAEKKEWSKLKTKIGDWDNDKKLFDEAVPRVKLGVEDARSHLGLTASESITVVLTDKGHTSSGDLYWHWTFDFHAPKCGPEGCAGHAYRSSDVGTGTSSIWRKDNHQLLFTNG
ncbi:hypothetical protein H0H92_005292 [Tricholoma furcatifolium]|nr:hypothetical protein H0H92_005292 [Tricholoma furcatifolium]